MRPGPRNPGESAADYNTRVKAMEAKWKAGMGGPKSGGTKAAGAGAGGGGGKPGGTTPSKPTGTTPVGPRTQSASRPPIDSGRNMTPTPPKPSTPKKPVVTTPTAIKRPGTPVRDVRRTGGGAGAGGGVKGGALPRPVGPVPPKTTVIPPRPISPKGGAGAGGGRGTAPRPGYGGGKPKMR
ncbi:MAG: hypothetical protein RJB04_1333 [Verrucomicrobiota bacterium]|jgi:hypothetical protein